MIGLGIFNIVIENEVDRLRQEIEMCLLEDMTEKYIKDKFGLVHDEKEETVINFKRKQITIGVVGSQHRVGVTTVARVSYVKVNDSG